MADGAPDLLTPRPTKPAKPARLTAGDMRLAMIKAFGAPEWAIMWEVGNATGAGVRGWADAVMMSLWPSRGLELHGVEIKISRADWKREAAKPDKAEKIAAYCDRWWIHCAPGVILDIAELPPAWGAREFDGRRWRTLKPAEKTPAAPMDRGFLAALLRRADVDQRTLIRREAETLISASREAMAAEIQRRVEEHTRGQGVYEKQVKAFEAASGLSLGDRWSDGATAAEIGALVKLIRFAGTHSSWNGVAQLQRHLDLLAKQAAEMGEKLAQALAESGPSEMDASAKAAAAAEGGKLL